MSMVTVTAETRAKLLATGGSQQVCDENGRVLGMFIPSHPGLADLILGPNISDEELERRAEHGVYISTAEVIARLEALPDV